MAARVQRGVGRRALALVEVVIAAAVLGVVMVILALAATDSRRTGQLSDSINNLKQFAWAGSSYAADSNERFWTFSWTRSEGGNPPYPDDLGAAAAQAIDIINRRASFEMSVPNGWVPHLLYSHLVLAEHLNLPLPTEWLVSPADTARLTWHRCTSDPDPAACFLSLPPSQRPTDGSQNDILRWMVSSSYQLPSAFISRDMRSGQTLTVQSALTSHYIYSINNGPLGDRLMTQVAHPSRKVQLIDQFQRHFGNRIAYFAYDEARVPLLMVDGSVTVRATSEANPGSYPNMPTSELSLNFNYVPRPWEHPTLSGGASELVTGHYAWTRGGLTGNDFGAPEVCTGQPGCTP